MKKGLLLAAIATSVLSLIFVFMAAERTMACSETQAALATINDGLDWDGTTKISVEQQADRMHANLDVLVGQKSQRNQWAVLALLMAGAAGSAFFFMKKQTGVSGAPTGATASE